MKLRLVISSAGEQLHESTFKFVQQQFHSAFEARLTSAAPRYAVACQGERPVAALAIRHLDWNEATLSEKYIQKPLEEWLYEQLQIVEMRQRLAEAGSLACADPALAEPLLKFAIAYSYLTGHSYIVMTATRAVRLMLRRMRFGLTHICDASPEVLDSETRSLWGSYYANLHQPKVCLLETTRLFEASYSLFREQINLIENLQMEVPLARVIA